MKQIHPPEDKMNETHPITQSQSSPPIRQIAARLIASLLVLIVFALAGFALYALFFGEGTYAVVTHTPEGFFSRIGSVILSQLPRTVWLLALYLSVFTVWGSLLSYALSAWHGLSLGCALALLRSGSLVLSGSAPALPVLFGFLSTVLLLLLAALTSVYARVLCSACLKEDGETRTVLLLEYTGLFWIISGAVYLFGCAAVLCY